MTPRQITLVQESFQKVAPIADTAAAIFYNRLFVLDPDVRAMFTGDMARQGRKLMTTLGVAVNGLSRPDEIHGKLEALGRRHQSYGVEPQHYETVGVALLWTLRKALDTDFTPEVRNAWSAAYGLVSQTMIAASERSPSMPSATPLKVA